MIAGYQLKQGRKHTFPKPITFCFRYWVISRVHHLVGSNIHLISLLMAVTRCTAGRGLLLFVNVESVLACPSAVVMFLYCHQFLSAACNMVLCLILVLAHVLLMCSGLSSGGLSSCVQCWWVSHQWHRHQHQHQQLLSHIFCSCCHGNCRCNQQAIATELSAGRLEVPAAFTDPCWLENAAGDAVCGALPLGLCQIPRLVVSDSASDSSTAVWLVLLEPPPTPQGWLTAWPACSQPADLAVTRE